MLPVLDAHHGAIFKILLPEVSSKGATRDTEARRDRPRLSSLARWPRHAAHGASAPERIQASMETQGLVGFRLRKRGAGVEQSAKAAKQATPAPAPAPAAKKRRVSTQPSVKQALLRAAAAPRAAEARGSDGIAALPLRCEAGQTAARADAAHAGAGGLDLGRAVGAAGPDTQPQEAEVEQRAAPRGVHAPARAAPLAAGRAAVDAAPVLHFEHEVRCERCAPPRCSCASQRALPPIVTAARDRLMRRRARACAWLSALLHRQALDSSDEDECDDEDGAEPSAVRARLPRVALALPG